MMGELDPEQVREHGRLIYEQGVEEYIRSSQSLVTAAATAARHLSVAAGAFVDLLAALEVQHRQMEDVADQLNPVFAQLGLALVGPTPDHMGNAVEALPPSLRDVVREGRLARGSVLHAFASAASQTEG